MQNTATTSVRHHVNEQQPTAVEPPDSESNAVKSSGNHFYAGAATSDFHCDYFGTSPRGASPGDYREKGDSDSDSDNNVLLTGGDRFVP